MNGYLKISEVAKKWGIKERRINTLCLEGRIEGAVKFGNTWASPEDAEKPKDERIKSGRYIKDSSEDGAKIEWKKQNNRCRDAQIRNELIN